MTAISNEWQTVKDAGAEGRRAMHCRLHHPVQEVPVPGAPALLPALAPGAGPPDSRERGRTWCEGSLAQVPGLDVLEVDGEPGLASRTRCANASEEAAEATDGLVGDPVVHVDQA